MAEINFYMSDQELDDSPSRKDGLDAATETAFRCFGAQMVQEAAILLNCPQAVAATGQVLLQRFYCKRSFKQYNVKKLAAAATYLAVKLEECTNLRLRDLILVFDRLSRRKDNLPPRFLEPGDKVYNAHKDAIIKYERDILRVFGFILHCDHPHKLLISLAKVLNADQNLLQEAWNIANDSLRTTLCVRFKSEVIASGVIFYAARRLQVPLPEEMPWWEVFSCKTEHVLDVVRTLHQLYQMPRVEYKDLVEPPLPQPQPAPAPAENGGTPARVAEEPGSDSAIKGDKAEPSSSKTLKPEGSPSVKQEGPSPHRSKRQQPSPISRAEPSPASRREQEENGGARDQGSRPPAGGPVRSRSRSQERLRSQRDGQRDRRRGDRSRSRSRSRDRRDARDRDRGAGRRDRDRPEDRRAADRERDRERPAERRGDVRGSERDRGRDRRGVPEPSGYRSDDRRRDRDRPYPPLVAGRGATDQDRGRDRDRDGRLDPDYDRGRDRAERLEPNDRSRGRGDRLEPSRDRDVDYSRERRSRPGPPDENGRPSAAGRHSSAGAPAEGGGRGLSSAPGSPADGKDGRQPPDLDHLVGGYEDAAPSDSGAGGRGGRQGGRPRGRDGMRDNGRDGALPEQRAGRGGGGREVSEPERVAPRNLREGRGRREGNVAIRDGIRRDGLGRDGQIGRSDSDDGAGRGNRQDGGEDGLQRDDHDRGGPSDSDMHESGEARDMGRGGEEEEEVADLLDDEAMYASEEDPDDRFPQESGML